MVVVGDNYGPLRAPELRWLCNQRGLSPYGLKRGLVARLDEQDQQGIESSSECYACGLEPFRELEELAAKYASERQASSGPRSAATAKTAAKAKEPPQTKASVEPKPLPVGPMASPIAPAQAKMPPLAKQGLTDEERRLRSMLEFFACADTQSTKSTGKDMLFALKYKDFVKTVFDFLQSDSAAPSSGLEPMASTAMATAAAAAAAMTDALLRGTNPQDAAPNTEINTAELNETRSSNMLQQVKEMLEAHLQAPGVNRMRAC